MRIFDAGVESLKIEFGWLLIQWNFF